MKKNFINELQSGQELNNEIFLVKKLRKAKTAANKEYWSLILADKTGEINAKIWEDNLDKCAECKSGEVISIVGLVDEFKEQKQIIVEKMIIVRDFDVSNFISQTNKDIKELFEIVQKNINKIQNQHIKSLINEFYANENFVKKIKQAPGAEKIHHAYIGGLLEHITEMLEFAPTVIKEYPIIDQDLLICGILLHDIGKMQELSIETTITRTIQGKLIGHLALGYLQVAKKIDQIENFPDELKYKILHLILSHHGKLEYGCPVKPALLEAVALFYLDELSAKTNIAAKLYEQGKDSPQLFSERHFALDNAEIYLGQSNEQLQEKLI